MRCLPAATALLFLFGLSGCSSPAETTDDPAAEASAADSSVAPPPELQTYTEDQYSGFDGCQTFKTALAKVFPQEVLTSRDPYKSFSESGEWINGCTVEGADPFAFSNKYTVRTYPDSARAADKNWPVEELPDGSDYGPGRESNHSPGATLQDTSSFGYESTLLRYVVGNHYIELQVGGSAGVGERVEDVAAELDNLIPAYVAN